MKVIYLRKGVTLYAPNDAFVLKVKKSVKPHILLDKKEYKHCTHCNSWRGLDKFHFCSRTFDRLQPFCMDCKIALTKKPKHGKLCSGLVE